MSGVVFERCCDDVDGPFPFFAVIHRNVIFIVIVVDEREVVTTDFTQRPVAPSTDRSYFPALSCRGSRHSPNNLDSKFKNGQRTIAIREGTGEPNGAIPCSA